MNRHRAACWLVGAVLVLSLPGCFFKSDLHGFATWPGFDEHFQKYPPTDTLPTAQEKTLLARYRPRLILPPGHAGPIDFYADYLPNTVMTDLATGKRLAEPPTRDDLVAQNRQLTVALDLLAPPSITHPTVYGRITREEVTFPDGEGQVTVPLTFLSYHVPFALSGLPAKLGWLQRSGIWLGELIFRWDRADWHELDVYTACTVVLDAQEQPFAVLLAQHNHHRAYRVGRDVTLPEDQRLVLDVAVSSNELYLSSHESEPVAHRTIPFPDDLDYLLSGENKPFSNGYDVTHGPNAGGVESDYALAFLPPSDPFYTFKGWLGEYRPFFGFYIGRSGSPGADYYALPQMMPLGNTLKFSYLRDGDADDIAAVRKYVDGWNMDFEGLMAHGGRRLWAEGHGP